eukprot:6092207-Amphidinium_carterae.1
MGVAIITGTVRFELTFGLFIMLNACIWALEVQQSGLEIGHAIHYPGIRKRNAEWPGSTEFFTTMN